MLDVDNLPKTIEWVRRNVWLAMAAIMFGVFFYAGYSFIGGYASKFGETFASNYGRFKTSIASYTVIDTVLHAYLTRYNASRISVARFHNSTRDVGNNELFYVSFENVLSMPGVTTETNFVDVPANVFSSVLPSLLDDKPILVWTKDLPENSLKDRMAKSGAKAALYVPVRDFGGRLIGMIVIGWITESDIPAPQLRAEMNQTMMGVASRIGAYFSAKE